MRIGKERSLALASYIAICADTFFVGVPVWLHVVTANANRKWPPRWYHWLSNQYMNRYRLKQFQRTLIVLGLQSLFTQTCFLDFHAMLIPGLFVLLCAVAITI